MTRPLRPGNLLMLGSIRRWLAYFRDNIKGASAVEAAILFPSLVLLLFGIIQFSLVLFTSNTIQNAVREVTRQLSVNSLAISDATAAITTRLPEWAQDAIIIEITESHPGEADQNVITVSASVSAAKATPVPPLAGLLSGWTLGTTLSMRQEAVQ